MEPISEKKLAAITDALLQGRKIEAIAAYREMTGVGLQEAKDAVERLEAETRSADSAGESLEFSEEPGTKNRVTFRVTKTIRITHAAGMKTIGRRAQFSAGSAQPPATTTKKIQVSVSGGKIAVWLALVALAAIIGFVISR